MYGNTTTRQFQAEMENFYGNGLDWFFDEWVWGRNRPHYTYSWMSEDVGNGQYEIFLHIDQTQESPAPELFIMPVKVYPFVDEVDTLITVWNDTREDDWRFIISGNPDSLIIDKDDWILKRVYAEDYGLNIITTDLPDGDPGENYYETIEAKGGILPYRYEIIEGVIPDGLDFNNDNGILSGIPEVEGRYSFTVQCIDSSEPQLIDTQDYILIIGDPTVVNEDYQIIPEGFDILGNYPNPFNSTTIIRININNDAYVKLNVFNMLGQEVASLHNSELSKGRHEFVFDANHLSSGLYFYKLQVGDSFLAKKMCLIK
jgi:hypothetical protein